MSVHHINSKISIVSRGRTPREDRSPHQNGLRSSMLLLKELQLDGLKRTRCSRHCSAKLAFRQLPSSRLGLEPSNEPHGGSG